MSYNDNFTIRWEKQDFTKHGTIAMYAIGECRCDACTTRWFAWSPDRATNKQAQVMRQMTGQAKIRKR
ncbi:MAG: hypothetical protein CMA83_03860 [Euryarchaeota archaeon]|nr:hypothetical protein [Euryarchaeota archaeon]